MREFLTLFAGLTAVALTIAALLLPNLILVWIALAIITGLVLGTKK